MLKVLRGSKSKLSGQFWNYPMGSVQGRDQFRLLPMFRENKYLCEWSMTLGMCVSNLPTPLLHLAWEAEEKTWKQSDCWKNWNCGRALPWGQGCCRAWMFGVLDQSSFSLLHTSLGSQAISTGFMATISAHQERLGSGVLCGTRLF